VAIQEPKRRRRDHGDGTIAWDKVNKCYVGSISLGYNDDGTRNRPSVRGKTKTEVKDKPGQAKNWIYPKIGTTKLTAWCAISAGVCWPGGLACWGYRSAARSETRPAMAVQVSSKYSRRPG
jgi:hypothetical protein